MKRIIITNFTDPVCVWCWGMEPVFRALETRYPMDIELRFVMGGLVQDISDFEDPANHIGGDVALINRQIGEHYVESALRHHMPVKAEGLDLFTLERPSSYPQCIAYKAAQMASPDKAPRLLRLLREGSIAEALPTNDPGTILRLAEQAGVDLPGFRRALDSGKAEQAFRTDLGLTAAMGVTAFPTFLVKTSEARQMMLRGFLSIQDFHRAISQLTDGGMKPLPSPPDEDVLLWLIHEQGRLAPEEVYQAFDFGSRQEAARWLEPIIAKGLVKKEEAGTGYFVSAN